MINITFRPDKTKIRKDGKVQLYIHFTKQSKRTKVSLPIRIELKYWSQTKQKALPKATHSTLINAQLTKYKQLAEKIYRLDMDITEFKTVYISQLKGTTDKDRLLLVNYIDYYIEKNRGLKKDSYLRIFSSVQKHLNTFNKKLTITNLSYSDLSLFSSYLMNDLQLNHNYIKRLLSNLKTVLKYAKSQGEQINESVFDIEIKSHESDSISLSESDLDKIRAANLNNNTLNKQRDVLLFACETGQRQSDRELLSRDTVKQDNKGRWYLDFIMLKTEVKCIVPLSSVALSILEKYNYQLPLVNLKNSNMYFKEICRLAAINEPTVKIIYKGGKRSEARYKKWELVSTHTARRTFATLVYNRTKNIKLVSKLLGHASIETTSKYLKIDDDELFGMFGE